MPDEQLTRRELEVIEQIAPLLADPIVWDDPRVGLGHDVVAAIGARPRPERAPVDRGRRWRAAVAGVVVGAAAAGAIAIAVGQDGPAHPDGTMAVVGAGGAPTVLGHGSFTQYSSGLEIEIRVPGLPRREGGDYYEMWMRNCDGSEWVPAGSFHDMEDVRGWAGVPAEAFPLLQISRESAASADSGSHGPSGDVVAQATLAVCPAA